MLVFRNCSGICSNFGRYAGRYITTESASPQNTSRMECCFKNTVERQMDTVSNSAPVRIHFLFFNALLLKMATQHPTELKV